MKDIIASTCVGVGQIAIGHPFDTTLVLIQNKKKVDWTAYKRLLQRMEISSY